jgi:hypothetical protein
MFHRTRAFRELCDLRPKPSKTAVGKSDPPAHERSGSDFPNTLGQRPTISAPPAERSLKLQARRLGASAFDIRRATGPRWTARRHQARNWVPLGPQVERIKFYST